ncbi:zinc-finger domain-containing protein [Methyloversatilis sp.]|uniref:zinc-finger domain-containing protein n=1 Tax=Methyloversatilis sp. TaxID=2569862 RepID=UPI0035B063DF
MTQAGTDSSRDRAREIEVSAKDLPLHCPLPDAPLWARHPRVFLDVSKTGQAACPYCGTRYSYHGPAVAGH